MEQLIPVNAAAAVVVVRQPERMPGLMFEDVLPVELNDRRGAVLRTSLGGRDAALRNKLVVTPEGESHPVMRIGDSREDLAIAGHVATFWLVANALERDPTLRERVVRCCEAPGREPMNTEPEIWH